MIASMTGVARPARLRLAPLRPLDRVPALRLAAWDRRQMKQMCVRTYQKRDWLVVRRYLPTPHRLPSWQSPACSRLGRPFVQPELSRHRLGGKAALFWTGIFIRTQNALVSPNVSCRYCSLVVSYMGISEAKGGAMDAAAGNAAQQGDGSPRNNRMGTRAIRPTSCVKTSVITHRTQTYAFPLPLHMNTCRYSLFPGDPFGDWQWNVLSEPWCRSADLTPCGTANEYHVVKGEILPESTQVVESVSCLPALSAFIWPKPRSARRGRHTWRNGCSSGGIDRRIGVRSGASAQTMLTAVPSGKCHIELRRSAESPRPGDNNVRLTEPARAG